MRVLLEVSIYSNACCTCLAAVISALEQAVKLKLVPFYFFEKGFLAVTVSSDFKFLSSLLKTTRHSQGVFIAIASTFNFAVMTREES